MDFEELITSPGKISQENSSLQQKSHQENLRLKEEVEKISNSLEQQQLEINMFDDEAKQSIQSLIEGNNHKKLKLKKERLQEKLNLDKQRNKLLPHIPLMLAGLLLGNIFLKWIAKHNSNKQILQLKLEIEEMKNKTESFLKSMESPELEKIDPSKKEELKQHLNEILEKINTINPAGKLPNESLDAFKNATEKLKKSITEAMLEVYEAKGQGKKIMREEQWSNDKKILAAISPKASEKRINRVLKIREKRNEERKKIKESFEKISILPKKITEKFTHYKTIRESNMNIILLLVELEQLYAGTSEGNLKKFKSQEEVFLSNFNYNNEKQEEDHREEILEKIKKDESYDSRKDQESFNARFEEDFKNEYSNFIQGLEKRGVLKFRAPQTIQENPHQQDQ